jgi:hypothetical protein
MKRLALILVLAGCGGRALEDTEPCSARPMQATLCPGSSGTLATCIDHEGPVTDCTVQHWPAVGVTVTALCVEACP